MLQIVGQHIARKLLREMVASNRTPHALLLHGPPGSGQLALALYLSALLQCFQRVNDQDICGICPACLKITNITHPDLHFLFPVPNLGEQKKKSSHFENQFRDAIKENPYISLENWLQIIQGEHKNPNISAESCREALYDLSLHRFEGNYKIMIIWLPEYLGKESNILLKEIEEPAPNTVIILASENTEAILPTILSRCQHIRLVPLNAQEIQQSLIQDHGIDEVLAAEISWLSGGHYGVALSNAYRAEIAHSTDFMDYLRAAYSGNILSMTEWSDRIASMSKDKQKSFLHYFLHLLQQSNFIGILPNNQLSIPRQEIESLNKLKPILTPQKIALLSQRIDEDLAALEQNANAKILFLALTIYLHRVFREKTTAELSS